MVWPLTCTRVGERRRAKVFLNSELDRVSMPERYQRVPAGTSVRPVALIRPARAHERMREPSVTTAHAQSSPLDTPGVFLHAQERQYARHGGRSAKRPRDYALRGGYALRGRALRGRGTPDPTQAPEPSDLPAPSSPTRRASLQHGRPEPRNWATFPWRTRGLDWMREIADSTIARGKEGLR
jgi:hypothetical protein